jgi:hypothetical protein
MTASFKIFFNSSLNCHPTDSQDLYLPQASLTLYQKEVYYVDIKKFNKLPIEIKSTFSNFKKFKVVLRHSSWLLIHFKLWMNI